jgi:hypothetical protein
MNASRILTAPRNLCGRPRGSPGKARQRQVDAFGGFVNDSGAPQWAQVEKMLQKFIARLDGSAPVVMLH